MESKDIAIVEKTVNGVCQLFVYHIHKDGSKHQMFNDPVYKSKTPTCRTCHKALSQEMHNFCTFRVRVARL